MDKPTRQNRVREALGRIYDQQPPYFREYLRRFQQDPTSRVFAPLAEAYRRLGRLDEAIEICREGLEHHPDFHGGRIAYAKCLADKKQLHDARRELERVVCSVPENLLAQRLLGEVNLVIGDKEAALHAFKMALLLSPADVALAEKVHQLERQAVQPDADPGPPPPRQEEWQPSSDSLYQPEALPPSVREDFVERNLLETEDPLGASSALDAMLNESDEELGDNLAPLWQAEASPSAHAASPPPKGAGHDDIFISEPLLADGFDLGVEDEDEGAGGQVTGSADAVVDEGLDALIGRESISLEEPFKVEHVSEIFRQEEEETVLQEITTETLGDLYFSQGQFERSLRIFEKLDGRGGSASLAHKIQACKARLGVTREQMVRTRQMEVLRHVLLRAKSVDGAKGASVTHHRP